MTSSTPTYTTTPPLQQQPNYSSTWNNISPEETDVELYAPDTPPAVASGHNERAASSDVPRPSSSSQQHDHNVPSIERNADFGIGDTSSAGKVRFTAPRTTANPSYQHSVVAAPYAAQPQAFTAASPPRLIQPPPLITEASPQANNALQGNEARSQNDFTDETWLLPLIFLLLGIYVLPCFLFVNCAFLNSKNQLARILGIVSMVILASYLLMLAAILCGVVVFVIVISVVAAGS